MVAAKEGGGDLEYNAALKSAIEKAKAANMPKDNIDRAIKKGTGDNDGAVFTELTYEGYGLGGIAVLVECLTDNTNRTAANIRSYFVKGKGNLGTNGCVSFMFDHKGVIVIDRTEDVEIDEEDLEMLVIEAGHEFSMAELRYLPQTMTELTGEGGDIKYMNKLIDLMDEDDDVQNMYHNWEETE